MLSLTKQDIILNQTAADKTQAIQSIGTSLSQKGLVEAEYVKGLLERETQSSTYLGNGIAIPHGTTQTRDLVKKTGVSVHHFPQGVDWGNGTVYIAIGIAAQSDEHLGILKQLTKVLSADGVEDALKSVQSEDEIIQILMGQAQLAPIFNEQLICLDFPAKDLLQLSAVSAGLIKNENHVDNTFVSQVITKSPTHLGEGIWLVSGDLGVQKTALSFVSSAEVLEYQGLPLKALLTIASCNAAHQSVVQQLAQLTFNGDLAQLVNAAPADIIHILTPSEDSSQVAVDAAAENQAIFKIKNAHGLHARPGAMLVASAKKFEASIQVRNLDGENKFVNAKSLMKVIAMGVKQGHQLEFVADGADAAAALDEIGKAIESGLGEG